MNTQLTMGSIQVISQFLLIYKSLQEYVKVKGALGAAR